MSNLKEYWDAIYADKSAQDVSWYQLTPTLSLTMINDCCCSKNDAIIDVGGGASVLVDHLLQQHYQQLSVLDISENALQYAKLRLGTQADKIDWICADITTYTPPKPFSIWHDRAVFHFLTTASARKKYIQTLNKSLNSGSFLILAAFSIDGPKMCSGLDIVQYDLKKLHSELGPGFKLINQQSELHRTPDDNEQQFTYYCFQKK